MDVYCKHIWVDNDQEVRTGFRVTVQKAGFKCKRCETLWDGVVRPPETIIGYTK